MRPGATYSLGASAGWVMVGESMSEWQELSVLYERADSLDGSERAAWIGELRRAGHRLVPQLERMMGARDHVASAEFMSALPRIETAADEPSPSWTEGSRVGAYRLVRHVGSGGMAEVWMAQRCDGAFERRVAIKLLFTHPTPTQRDTFIERFRRERDFLASLDHPNIAALHDAGVTPGGQPWLALEYLDGTPITTWCDERGSTLVARAELFVRALAAVEHAHANLVLHRDLKPSNILVTSAGEVKLLDFGISKLMAASEAPIAETDLTHAAGRPLTLMYASPEQVGGKPLSTGSDVYSLGVVGYELFAGVHPYRLSANSYSELERAVLEVEPGPPSRSSTCETGSPRGARRYCKADISPDLDAVVLRALDKDPARRYASVEAFRIDLERWLAGKPVSAVAPSLLYQATKFARRHRTGVVLAGMAAVASVAAVTSIVVIGLHARSEASRALAARDFVFDLFHLADPDSAGAQDVTAREVLVAGIDKAATQFAEQPELQADVLSRIAETQSRLGDYRAANGTLKRVVDIETRTGHSGHRIKALIALADNYFRLGDLASARQSLAAIEAATRNDPPSPSMRADIALVQGWVLLAEGHYERSRVEMDRSLRESRAIGGDEARVIDALRGLAEAESYVSAFDAALVHIREAAQRASAASEPVPSNLVSIQWEVAKVQVGAGRFADARRTVGGAIARCDASLGTQHENCALLEDLQTTILLRLGEPVAALQALPRLIQQANDDRSPRRQIEALMTASRVVAANAMTANHGDLLRRLETIGGPSANPPVSDPVRVQILLTLAEVDILTGRPSQAVSRLRAALDAMPMLAHDNLLHGRAAVLLGVALQDLGEFGAALPLLDDALQRYESAYGREHPLVALYGLNYAVSLDRTGRHREARDIVEVAVPILTKAMGETSPVVVRAREIRARFSSAPAGADDNQRPLRGFFS